MTISHEDRTVHAIDSYGRQIVRYDRAGKWFLEGDPSRNHMIPSRRLTLAEAVSLAALPGSRVFSGLPGGMAFHARLERAKRSIT